MLCCPGVVSITEDWEYLESVDASAQKQDLDKAHVEIPICFELSCLALKPKSHYKGLQGLCKCKTLSINVNSVCLSTEKINSLPGHL